MKNSRLKISTFCISLVWIIISVLFSFNYDASSESESQGNSNYLRYVEERNGRDIIMSYRDENGNYALASDKGYAIKIDSYDVQNRLVREAFFDANEEYINQSNGYSVVEYYYQDNGCWIEYKNDRQERVSLPQGYALIFRTFDNQGRTIQDFYFDENEEVAECAEGYHSKLRVYSSCDYNDIVLFFNADNELQDNIYGFAEIKQILNAQGQIVEQYFYTATGDIAILSDSQSGYQYGYDDLGRQNSITFIDSNGNSANGRLGYATLNRTLYPDGSIETERYFDKDEQPVALVRGIYGVKYYNGEKITLGINGMPQLTVENMVLFAPWLVTCLGLICCFFITYVKHDYWKKFLFLAYVLYIMQVTLFREKSGGLNLELFWSYKLFFTNYNLRMQIIKNIWLFIPLGAGIRSIMQKPRHLFILFLLSIFIEFAQLIFHVGLCEMDDIFNNTLGGCLGYMLACEIEKVKKWFP